MCVLMFVRLGQLWKAYVEYFLLQHKIKDVASKLYNTNMQHLFTLKVTLETSPLTSLLVFFALFTMVLPLFTPPLLTPSQVGGFAIQVSEAPYTETLPSQFWNCCWFVVVTAATVGCYSLSHPARFSLFFV